MDMICRTFQMLLAWKDPYSGYYEFNIQINADLKPLKGMQKT